MPYKVVLCLRGGVGGVDVFSCNFVEELTRRGVEAKIMLTTRTRNFLPAHMPIDDLPIRKEDSWPTRWRAMIRYLESQAPCVFLPNYEYNYSCISPHLSEKILIVGIVHSDENIYYDHVVRLGKYWNGLVAVSQEIANHIAAMNLPFSTPMETISYGVPLPSAMPLRKFTSDEPLRIAYAGRLVRLQKRVQDLPEIFHRLVQRNANVEITIIGDGPERGELVRRCEPLVTKGQVRYAGALSNRQVLESLEKQDVILLTSDFEGMPIAILEAMGRGCVPVVSQIRSGIPELVQDSHNGFIVGIGNIDDYADRLCLLQRDPVLRKKMSLRAYQTVRERFTLKQMTDNYVHFLDRLQQDSDRGAYRRPKGDIVPPPDLKLSWKQYLPSSIRSIAIQSRRAVKRITKSGETRAAKSPR